MNRLSGLYRQSLALLTDLYELTMAYGYWKLHRTEEEAVFNLFFRKHPFRGGFTIACGLEYVIDFLERFQFTADDIKYLARLTGNDKKPLFEPEFLEYLRKLELSVDIQAIPEGTIVFPHQPLLRVSGPIIQCQIIETALLNIINFQTLIATKAARICDSAAGEPVLEFGLRRAQGIDGSLAASRAAYIGGCAATSNVLAGKLFGIPVKGTHAHSWVMSFTDELESFEAYARAMPNNCVFLVDTYDTLEGVRKAIEAGRKLRQGGYEMVGIRLDSGDLAYLSIEARKLLNEAGFENAAIVASNDLDEHLIDNLKKQGATIAVWGVGTKLVTAYGDPALGGVYKLSAVRKNGEKWQYKLKLSEQAIKISIPGMLQVRRYLSDGSFIADMIYDEELGVAAEPVIVDMMDETRRKNVSSPDSHEDLLVPVLEKGKRIYDSPGIEASRNRAAEQLRALHPAIKRLLNPHEYPAGLERNLFDMRQKLILHARGADE